MREHPHGAADGARCSRCERRITRCAICGMNACSRPLCEPCFLDESGIPPALHRDFLANARRFQEE